MYARFARQEAVRRAREAAERDRVSAARRPSEEPDRSTPASRSTVPPPAAVSTTSTPAVGTGGPAAAAREAEVHFTTTQGGRRVFERVLTYSRGRLEKIEVREADATNPKANASEATFMYSDGKAYSRLQA